jgi:hypothetical protein
MSFEFSLRLKSTFIKYSPLTDRRFQPKRQSIAAAPQKFPTWTLKDITITPGTLQHAVAPVAPNYEIMKEVVKLYPSIESFNGRGDMLEVEESWERLWPWRSNIYMDELTKGSSFGAW